MTETSIAALNSASIQPSGASAPTHCTYLDQVQASAFLLTLGVRRAPKTLQKARHTGDGCPPYRKVLGRVIYEQEPLRTWAEAQRSPLVQSTSELPAKPRKAA